MSVTQVSSYLIHSILLLLIKAQSEQLKDSGLRNNLYVLYVLKLLSGKKPQSRYMKFIWGYCTCYTCYSPAECTLQMKNSTHCICSRIFYTSQSSHSISCKQQQQKDGCHGDDSWSCRWTVEQWDTVRADMVIWLMTALPWRPSGIWVWNLTWWLWVSGTVSVSSSTQQQLDDYTQLQGRESESRIFITQITWVLILHFTAE